MTQRKRKKTRKKGRNKTRLRNDVYKNAASTDLDRKNRDEGKATTRKKTASECGVASGGAGTLLFDRARGPAVT